MAKALLGYMATTSPQTRHETAILRRRVADLEAEVLRLKRENDALNLALTDDLSTADLLASASS